MALCDSYDEKADAWNAKLSECIEKKYGTKTNFAIKFSEKYKEKFTEKNGERVEGVSQQQVSRWCSVGNITGRGTKIGFPTMENMCRIAEMLEVDLGYLLGEQREAKYTMQEACDFTGLNAGSIERIKSLTIADSRFDKDPDTKIKAREVLNSMLNSSSIQDFVKELYELIQVDNEMNQRGDQMMEELCTKYGITVAAKAALWSGMLDAGFEDEEPNKEILDAVLDFRTLMDKNKERTDKLEIEGKARRFALSEIYTRMIDHILSAFRPTTDDSKWEKYSL